MKPIPSQPSLTDGECQDPRRRALLQLAGVSGASLLGLPGFAFASQNLHTLPRIALIIGNERYGFAPLANPANDAKAMASSLSTLGFDVTIKTDAQRGAMETSILEFCARLASNKAVGLFYYAGHGLQVNWRNYLVPVDAKLEKNADIERQALDLNLLLQGLAKASNPMNVVILDACRDNPFGGVAKTGKGLSQIDAPLGTLLAYATAPGNVAQDGSGSNGLYTGNLLRELSVPEARIEDVFKRVRLNVRKASQGQQIPWESTSLEEDFYFLPPANIRKLSEKDKERLFLEESKLFEQATSAKTIQGFETYLKRYPSGNFSELAQVQLNILLAKQGEKAVKAMSAPENPFSRGSAETRLNHRIGDSYTYRVSDAISRATTRSFEQIITAITDTEIIYNDGALVTDLLGNWRKDWAGRTEINPQHLPLEYVVGKQWRTHYPYRDPRGTPGTWTWSYKITRKEPIQTAMGTFECYRVEGKGEGSLGFVGKRVFWLAPESFSVPIALEEITTWSSLTAVADRLELTAVRRNEIMPDTAKGSHVESPRTQ